MAAIAACLVVLLYTCVSCHVIVPDENLRGAIARIANDTSSARQLQQTDVAVDSMPTLYDARQKIVTLGDSYSSGTGIWKSGKAYDETYGGSYMGYKLTAQADDQCWREEDDTPGPIYAAIAPKERTSIFMACKGAEIAHVWNQFQLVQRQWVDDTAKHWKHAIFVLTVGANDVRTAGGHDWAGLLEVCTMSIQRCSTTPENQFSNLKQIQQRLQALFEIFAIQAGRATFRVLGYPQVMRPSRFSCLAVTGVSLAEAQWIDGQVDSINEVVENAVNATASAYPDFDIQFVGVDDRLQNGACHLPVTERHINDRIVTGLYRSDASFHPTRNGYRQYYDAFVESLTN